jgi:hypothetical protein
MLLDANLTQAVLGNSVWPLSYEELSIDRNVAARLGSPDHSSDCSLTGSINQILRRYTQLVDIRDGNRTANGCEVDGENARSLQCTSASGRNVQIRSRKCVFASGTVATSRFFLSTQRHSKVSWSSLTTISVSISRIVWVAGSHGCQSWPRNAKAEVVSQMRAIT